MLIYLMNLALFLIGLYAVIAERNLIKKVIGFGIIEYAVNLFFILVGYKIGGEAPIFQEGALIQIFVDPLPQALVLTSIVIGLGTTALMVGLCIRVYQRFGTFDINEIRSLKG